jgi:hypothetical protein
MPRAKAFAKNEHAPKGAALTRAPHGIAKVAT